MKAEERVYKSGDLVSVARFVASAIVDRWRDALVALALGTDAAAWVVIAEKTRGGMVFRVFRRDP
jgi:hypothetical protein